MPKKITNKNETKLKTYLQKIVKKSDNTQSGNNANTNAGKKP